MTKIDMKKTSPKKGIKKKPPKDTPMDIMFSKIVRSLAGWKCELCGKSTGQLHCHHFIGRRYKATRWTIENAISVCAGAYGCHSLLEDFPKLSWETFIKRVGSKRAEELELTAMQRPKPDKEKIQEELKIKIRGLENGN